MDRLVLVKNYVFRLELLACFAFFTACGSASRSGPHLTTGEAHETPALKAPSVGGSSSAPPAQGGPPSVPATSAVVVNEIVSNSPFRGKSPLDAPPSRTQPTFLPPPARPAGTDTTPADLAESVAACAPKKSCGVCNNSGFCGFCEATKKCVPKDKYGPLAGTCSGGYTPSDCRLALYVEEQEPNIRERLTSLMGDLKPDGMPVDTSAERPSVLRIPVHRGRCYGVVYRASYDFEGSINAEPVVEARFIGGGGYWAPVYTEVYGLTPFCPLEEGNIVIATKPSPKTTGTWRMQLFSKSIPEAELLAEEERLETAERIEVVRSSCSYCARGYVGCFLVAEPQCEAKYLFCLKQFGVTPLDCERGDVPKPPPPEKPLQAKEENCPLLESRDPRSSI